MIYKDEQRYSVSSSPMDHVACPCFRDLTSEEGGLFLVRIGRLRVPSGEREGVWAAVAEKYLARGF